MTPLVQGPLRAPLRRLGAVCCDPRATASDACGGQLALHQRQRQRLPQQRPSAPWPVRMKPSTGPWPCPLGIAHAHGPGFVALACRAAGPEPTASTPARPARPGLSAGAHGPRLVPMAPWPHARAEAGPMHLGREPTTRRSAVALPPCSCARAIGSEQGPRACMLRSTSWWRRPRDCATWPLT